MKNKFCLFLALLISLSSFSQKIKWGTEAKSDKANGYTKTLGWYDDYLYTLEKDAPTAFKYGGTKIVQKISKTLNVVSTIDIKLENILKIGSSFDQLYEDRLEFFTIEYPGKGLGALFEIHYYELNGGFIEKKTVAKLDDDELTVNNELSYTVHRSKDKKNFSYLIIKAEGEIFDTYAFEVINFDHLGENLNRFQFDVKSEQQLSRIYIDSYSIDHNDNHVIWCSEYIEGKDEINIRILVVNKNGETISDKSINNKELILNISVVKFNKKGNYYFAGMLEKQNGKDRVKVGFFLGNYNTDTYEIDKIVPYSYTEEFFDGIGYKVKNSGTIKFYGWYSLDVLIDESENGYLIANHKRNSGERGYIYNEILVIPFLSDLTLGEIKVIPRSVVAYPPYLNGLSHYGFLRSNSLYLIYTDHKKNIDIKDIGKLKDVEPKDGNASIYLAEINMDEEVKRKIISDKNEIGYNTSTNSNHWLS